MTDRYLGRWHDPAEPAWVVAPTSEWHPQFPGQRYPGDIGLRATPRPAVRGRAAVPGRTSTPNNGEDRWNVDEFRHRPERTDRFDGHPPQRRGATYPSSGAGEVYPPERRHRGQEWPDPRPVSPGWSTPRDPAGERPPSWDPVTGWSAPRDPFHDRSATPDPSHDRSATREPSHDWSGPASGWRREAEPTWSERPDRPGTPYRRGGWSDDADPGDTQPLPPGHRATPGARTPRPPETERPGPGWTERWRETYPPDDRPRHPHPAAGTGGYPPDGDDHRRRFPVPGSPGSPGTPGHRPDQRPLPGFPGTPDHRPDQRPHPAPGREAAWHGSPSDGRPRSDGSVGRPPVPPEPDRAGQIRPADPGPLPGQPRPVRDEPFPGQPAPTSWAESRRPVEHTPAAQPAAPDPRPAPDPWFTAAPTSGAPVSGVPVSGAPTSAPVSGVPTSGAPVSDTPVSGAPVSGMPVPDASVPDAPGSGAPVSGAPVRGWAGPVSAPPAAPSPVPPRVESPATPPAPVRPDAPPPAPPIAGLRLEFLPTPEPAPAPATLDTAAVPAPETAAVPTPEDSVLPVVETPVAATDEVPAPTVPAPAMDTPAPTVPAPVVDTPAPTVPAPPATEAVPGPDAPTTGAPTGTDAPAGSSSSGIEAADIHATPDIAPPVVDAPIDLDLPVAGTPINLDHVPADAPIGVEVDLADAPVRVDLPVVGAPIGTAQGGAVVPEFRWSAVPATDEPVAGPPIPCPPAPEPATGATVAAPIPVEAPVSAPPVTDLPDSAPAAPVSAPPAAPVTAPPAGDAAGPVPPVAEPSGDSPAAEPVVTGDEPNPAPEPEDHLDDRAATPGDRAPEGSGDGTPEVAPLPSTSGTERPVPVASTLPTTDPEQTLAAYRWRLDPDTLREVADEPDTLRAVREQLGAKLDAASDDRARARLLSLRAVVSRILGDLDRALADGTLALTHAEATGELRRIAIVKARLAHVHQWRGEFDEADRLYTEANSSELPDRLRATMHEHAGRCCLEQGRYIEACTHFERALDLRTVVDADLVARTELALDAVFNRVAAKGWGPYPRTPEEIRYAHRPPVPCFDQDTRRWGYADVHGELTITADYAEAQPFRDGVAWVRRPEMDAWTLIDETGTCLIGATAGYRGVGSFSDGIAWVSHNGAGDWLAVDKSGTVLIPAGFDDVRPFRRGVAAVRRGGWGAVDRTGQVVVPTSYSGFTTALTDGRYIDGFTDEGLAVVDVNGRKGVVDRAGRVVVPPTHPALVIHPVAFLVGDSGQWGALDRRGRRLIDPVHRSRLDVMAEIDRLLADTTPVL
ncbi:WG repeat-containing protein [Micromonospora sp. CPCC 206060]|uniref:WG repeat-containing protein n=1 Tax=Micromonospora sp. CPCC 206060 TaxID=3122406 RepID=UPI002FF212B7